MEPPEPKPLPLKERFQQTFDKIRDWEITQRDTPIIDQHGAKHGWQDGIPYKYDGGDRQFRVTTDSGGNSRPIFIGGITITEIRKPEEDPSQSYGESCRIAGGYRGHVVSISNISGERGVIQFGFANTLDSEEGQGVISRAEEMITSLTNARLIKFDNREGQAVPVSSPTPNSPEN